MAEVNRRLTDLETVLGEYMAQNALAARRAQLEQAQRDEEMRQFKGEMKDFKDEMKDFKDEMKDFKDEMKDFKDEMNAFKNRIDKFVENSEKSREEMNKKWGDLVNKLGTIVEDIVAPSIPAVAAKYFGIADYDKLLVNAYVRSSVNRSVRREFDVVLIAETAVLWNETKSTVRQDYMEQFISALPSFTDFFPECTDKRLVPIFSSLKLTVEQIKFLSRNNIYAMAMTGSVMDIMNFNDVAA
ncbi:MAG: hypothetical protein HY22_11860 [[Candidatus Thermochlorobacteriaceae] bacterium GBChlB]|nr:MAG: hypothetical protein HY22_11860 [[Candidatus Thermochlorobacteriaceae] bacterium GBChlB]